MILRNILAFLFAFLLSMSPALAARTSVSVIDPVSINGTISANGADITMTAGDAANGNSCALTGRLFLFVYNSDASAQTITITSVADNLGRTGDISAYSVGAGEFALFGPFPNHGWRQTDGKLYFTVSDAAVKVAPVKVPNSL